MKLYNCEAKEELELKELELTTFTNKELINLAEEIKKLFDDHVLQDENIVIAALTEITIEIGIRILI